MHYIQVIVLLGIGFTEGLLLNDWYHDKKIIKITNKGKK